MEKDITIAVHIEEDEATTTVHTVLDQTIDRNIIAASLRRPTQFRQGCPYGRRHGFRILR